MPCSAPRRSRAASRQVTNQPGGRWPCFALVLRRPWSAAVRPLLPPIVPLSSPDLCYAGGEVIGQLPGGSESGLDAVGHFFGAQVDHCLAVEALEVGGVAAVPGLWVGPAH